MPRKSRKLKKSKRKTRIKGGISKYNFTTLNSIVKRFARKIFYMRRLKHEIELINGKIKIYNASNPQRREAYIELTEKDWDELIAKSFKDGIHFYFDNSELGQHLKRKFNYDDPSSFSKYLGNITSFPLKNLYPIIVDNSKNSIYFKDLIYIIDELNVKGDVSYKEFILSDIELCELIAECYFRDRIYFIFDESENGRRFNKIFDYTYLDIYFYYLGNIVDDGTHIPEITFEKLESPPRARDTTQTSSIAPQTPPRVSRVVLEPRAPSKPRAYGNMPLYFPQSPPYESIQSPPRKSAQAEEPRTILRTLSLSQSVQGNERTCFAHSAALIIFHNVYDLPLTDYKLYVENNCNSFLDTTTPLPEYTTLQTNCGLSGAMRILLFRYIYQVIVNKFGCHTGPTITAMNYYLNEPFHPEIFETLNDVLMKIHASVNYSNFTVSSVDMEDFSKLKYKPYLDEYFQKYYANISTLNPRHAIAIVGQDKTGIIGKDSMYGTKINIPFSDLHSKGIVKLQGRTLEGIRNITFLYNKETRFTKEFSDLLEKTIVK